MKLKLLVPIATLVFLTGLPRGPPSRRSRAFLGSGTSSS